MTHKFKKHSFRKSYHRKPRGKRTTLKRTIQRVLNRNTETKFFDVSVENAQLYHMIVRMPKSIGSTVTSYNKSFVNR